MLSIDNTDPSTGTVDNKCFMISCVASKILPRLKIRHGKHISLHQERRSTYIDELQNHGFNWDGISMPMDMSQFAKFSEQNPTIDLHVFVYEEGDSAKELCSTLARKSTRSAADNLKIRKEIRNSIYPLYSSNKTPQFRVRKRIARHTHADTEVSNLHEIHILLILDENDSGWEGHYALIRNFDALISQRSSKSWSCKNCVNSFTTEDRLNNHRSNCLALGMQQVTVPEEQSYSFNKYGRMVKAPYRYCFCVNYSVIFY